MRKSHDQSLKRFQCTHAVAEMHVQEAILCDAIWSFPFLTPLLLAQGPSPRSFEISASWEAFFSTTMSRPVREISLLLIEAFVFGRGSISACVPLPATLCVSTPIQLVMKTWLGPDIPNQARYGPGRRRRRPRVA